MTGCNEAFIINEEQRNKILADCKNEEERTRTAKIIRPILRGRDIKKNDYQWAGLYCICTFPAAHIDINRYPAIEKWLTDASWSKDTPKGKGQLKLEQTGIKHVVDGRKIKSRKKTSNMWFETQDQIAYMDDFDKQKICYSETNDAIKTKICLDSNKYVTDKTCFILVANDEATIKHIYKIMSSSIFSWYMQRKSPRLGMQGISLTKDSVELFPMAPISSDKAKADYKLTDDEMKYISSSLKW